MSKDISSVLNIEQNVDNSLATLACLQNDFKAVLEKCSKIDNIAEDLNNLKSAVEKRNARRIIVSDSSASESDTPILTQQLTTNNDTDHNDDSDDSKNDDSVFEHDTASDVIEHSTVTLSPQNA